MKIDCDDLTYSNPIHADPVWKGHLMLTKLRIKIKHLLDGKPLWYNMLSAAFKIHSLRD